MENFLNSPEKRGRRIEVIDDMCKILNIPYLDTLIQETSKKDLTVTEINMIINRHIIDLIHEFNLEYSDFKPFMLLWEEEMKAEEKERRELWD